MRKTLLIAGLFASTAWASQALAQPSAPEGAAKGGGRVRLCTGLDSGNYHAAGAQIREQGRGRVEVVLQPTQGSLDNLDRLSRGECDAAIVQSDALFVYGRRRPGAASKLEQAQSLYSEYIHFICNPAFGLDKITGLTKEMRVEVGNPGGGTGITWEAFTVADKARYEPVPTDPYTGPRAISRVVAQTPEGTNSRTACMMYVTGLNAPSMREVDDFAKQNPGKLALVNAADSDLPKVKDDHGQPLYEVADIPAGTYPNLQPRGLFGGGKDVRTLTVRATLVVNRDAIERDDQAHQEFLRAVARATPSIRQRVGQ